MDGQSSSQPIALPSSNHSSDHIMASVGSYTGSNGDFNPASYTRHFLGSPISWRAGSFGAKIPSGSPNAIFSTSFDQNTVRMSTSIDGERSSLLNALNVFDREGELCRNYTCCGLQLNDLHTLLEHFEDVHLVVLDPTAPQPQAHLQVPFNPQSHPPLEQSHQPSYYPAQMPSQPYQAPSDPDDMELELELDNSALQYPTHYHHHHHHHPPPPPPSIIPSAHSSPSSGVPTPPDTPISTPLSSYPSPTSISHQQHIPLQAPSPYTSQPSSPHAATFDPNRRSSNSPPSSSTNTRPNLNLNLTAATQFSARGMMQHQVPNPEEAFNPYARFASDYSSCLPGAQYNPAPTDDASMHPGFSNTNGANVLQSPHLMHLQHGFMGQGQPSPSVAPALLFSSNATTPCSTPATSRVPSPTATSYPTLGLHPNALSQGNTPISSVPSTPISPTSRSPTHAGKTTGLTRHASTSSLNTSATLRATTSLLLSKPFKCPKPNCNKSYKQANGLKYHITHGSCNFAPPKDLEHVKDLLERKRRDKERAAAESGAGLSQNSVDDYSDLTAISESELREVEREAEKRLRPYACSVGDCQRRYKNMNGLRYHYQHSGEHGAVGLAMLANGQHECLAGSSRHHGHSFEAEKRGSLSSQGSVDREGRRRVVVKGGSASVPVSRATSTSRTGTPVPMSAMMGFSFAQQQQQLPTQPTQAQPFTPPSSQLLAQQLSLQQQQQHSQSHPSSPTHTQPQHMQQQQQLAYQQHFASLQRQQYAMQQQQAQQFAAMYHQQQQHQGMGLDGSLGG